MNTGCLEQLIQLQNLTWDGNLISKGDRDNLLKNELIIKQDGFNVISKNGIILLKSLGILNT